MWGIIKVVSNRSKKKLLIALSSFFLYNLQYQKKNIFFDIFKLPYL